jgi:sugar lactone lactonase YvrE
VDPVAKTANVFEKISADGLSLSPDGKTLYAAIRGGAFAGHVLGFDITTKAMVFDSGTISGGLDGIALGKGPVAGNLFVNTNGGTRVEVNLATAAKTTIATGGSRGDFVAVDPNDGTLLVTQTDRIMRVVPGVFAIPRLPTITALSALTASAALGQSITFTATVSDLLAGGAVPDGGTVTFSDQNGAIASETLLGGVAELTTMSLVPGTNVVSASYGGTAEFAPSTTGTIVTAAGNGTAGYAGNNGPATSALLNGPWGVATDSVGDVFIADQNNNVIREVVEATGDMISVAGNGTAGYTGNNGPATAAQLNAPNTVAVDSAGDLFISDQNNNVVREVVEATGEIITVAGNGTAGYSGDNGPATSGEIDSPRGIAIDSAGNLFIADWGNNVIREVVNATGDIVTVAGNGDAGYSGDNGPATAAALNGPNSVAIDSAGDLFIADGLENAVREVVKASGDIITFAGDGTAGYSGDNGPATAAKLKNNQGVAVDSLGDVFITDNGNNVVREVVRATGDIITVAGDGTGGYSGDNGPATAAELEFPGRVAVASTGGLYVADLGNNVVREVTPAVTVAMSGATLVIQTQPSTTATAGRALASQPVIYLEDSNGHLLTNDNSTVVTVSLASGTGTLQGTKSVKVEGGVATFGDISDTKAGTISLQFSAAGATAGPSTSITISPGPAYQLLIHTQPSQAATAGQPFAIQPIVYEVDRYGNLETADNSTAITVSLAIGNGALIGMTTATTSAGVAAFAGLGDNRPGIISLQFLSLGLGVGPSNNIVVSSVAAPTPTVMGESVVTSQKTNQRGKALGKKIFSGFKIQYSLAMDATSVGNRSNYHVEATTIKGNKNKRVTSVTPVRFKANYDPSSDSVTLTIIGKNPFALGGQISIVGSPPNGVRSQAGAFLSSSEVVLLIGKNAQTLSLV